MSSYPSGYRRPPAVASASICVGAIRQCRNRHHERVRPALARPPERERLARRRRMPRRRQREAQRSLDSSLLVVDEIDGDRDLAARGAQRDDGVRRRDGERERRHDAQLAENISVTAAWTHAAAPPGSSRPPLPRRYSGPGRWPGGARPGDRTRSARSSCSGPPGLNCG